MQLLSTKRLEPALIDNARSHGITIQSVPFISTRPLADAATVDAILQAGRRSGFVVFTSAQAVNAVAAALAGLKPDWQIGCLEGATLKAVQHHFPQLLVSATATDSLTLATVLLSQNIPEVTFFCGQLHREEIPQQLEAAGRTVNKIVVYETVLTPQAVTETYDGILFFSPSGVQSFFSQNSLPPESILFAIGHTTAKALQHLPNKLLVSATPSAEAMVAQAITHFTTSHFPETELFMNTPQDHLLLRALRGESVERPPVWMMRQAGRFLPEYRALREKYDFFTRVQTPELACEITLQPIDRVGTDAAIIFSDILVIPQALGLEVLLEENKGPVLPKTIATAADVDALQVEGTADRLHYVMEALTMTKAALNGRVPLIGFAGAPWTLLCYMVEGKGSKSFDKAKQFCFSNPELAHRLLQKITDATVEYLRAQVAAGADLVQVFDSWSGMLSPGDFKAFAQPYLEQIVARVKDVAPVILFPKGSWYALKDLTHSGAAALGLDWSVEPKLARELTGNSITLQGNFDPSKLLAPIPEIKKAVKEMIDGFGTQRYIANLGHGILPNVPVDHAQAFVDAVKEYGR